MFYLINKEKGETKYKQKQISLFQMNNETTPNGGNKKKKNL